MWRKAMVIPAKAKHGPRLNKGMQLLEATLSR